MKGTGKHRQPGFFTVDVEDFYHIIGVSGTPNISEWDSINPRVSKGFFRLLELLDSTETKATFFFLGYIAKRFPELVKEAHTRGHEIASHGMYHQEVRHQSSAEFLSDAKASKALLEDISGEKLLGWRSAGFSMNQHTPWFFDKLLEAGYSYDSSIVPNRLGHKRLFAADASPAFVTTGSGRIFEFPIGVADIGMLQVGMFGGGYLRFFPQAAICRMALQTLQKRPLLIYIHPREMDPGHPRISMNPFRYFKSYINMSSVPDKLGTLLSITEYRTLGEYYAEQCSE